MASHYIFIGWCSISIENSFCDLNFSLFTEASRARAVQGNDLPPRAQVWEDYVCLLLISPTLQEIVSLLLLRASGYVCTCLMLPVGKTEVYDPEPAVHSFFTSILPYTFQE